VLGITKRTGHDLMDEGAHNAMTPSSAGLNPDSRFNIVAATTGVGFVQPTWGAICDGLSHRIAVRYLACTEGVLASHEHQVGAPVFWSDDFDHGDSDFEAKSKKIAFAGEGKGLSKLRATGSGKSQRMTMAFACDTLGYSKHLQHAGRSPRRGNTRLSPCMKWSPNPTWLSHSTTSRTD
jgi:hypothetical protein